jgi:disulfide bond formation protein DsbB
MKLISLLFLLGLVGASYAAPLRLKVGTMISGATATGAGTTYGPATSGEKTFQAVVTGTGAVTATVLIQVSNNVSTQGWATLGTITLSGTTTATDGFASQGAWAYYRANVTAISGTSATVTVTKSEE